MSSIEKGSHQDWYDDGYKDGYNDCFEEQAKRISEQEKLLGEEAEKFMDAYMRLEAKNKALREQLRWVPVSERLPEMNVEVLTYDGDEIISDRLWEPEHGQVGFSLTGAGLPVSHWMPLPPPPMESGQ